MARTFVQAALCVIFGRCQAIIWPLDIIRHYDPGHILLTFIKNPEHAKVHRAFTELPVATVNISGIEVSKSHAARAILNLLQLALLLLAFPILPVSEMSLQLMYNVR
mmetsp:Transcript_30792/g.71071  ORF Transcript_30792/g.71071 Transcript_30792/m.71071 type:complete len:107 (+) Transcript_30792:659-979(+)